VHFATKCSLHFTGSQIIVQTTFWCKVRGESQLLKLTLMLPQGGLPMKLPEEEAGLQAEQVPVHSLVPVEEAIMVCNLFPGIDWVDEMMADIFLVICCLYYLAVH
jgi:hypothetical protein